MEVCTQHRCTPNEDQIGMFDWRQHVLHLRAVGQQAVATLVDDGIASCGASSGMMACPAAPRIKIRPKGDMSPTPAPLNDCGKF